MRPRVSQLSVVVALLTACATGPDRSEPESSPTPGPETRSEDIELCVHALHRPVGVQHQVEACRNLWLEPTCRNAWTASLAEDPGRRGEYVIASCAEAYCDQAAEQRVCNVPPDEIDLLDDDVDWLDEWTRFNAIVLSRDLRLDEGDRRGAVIARRLLQLVATSGAGIAPTEEDTDTDGEDEVENERPSDGE